MKIYNVSGYVTLVRSFRVLVMLGIVISVTWLVYDIFQNQQKHTVNSLVSGLQNPMSQESYAESPKLYGYDEKNNSYYVQARQGMQKGKDKFHLEEVYSQYVLSDKSIVGLLGSAADIDLERNKLKTEGDVIVSYNDDYTLAADAVLFDYKQNIVEGEGQVALRSKQLQVYSNNFTVTDEFHNIEFFSQDKRVRTVLTPSS